MISFEGGAFMMESNEETSAEQPVHQMQVAPFKLDRSPVTIEEFPKFVEVTGFKTDAEKYGDSGVFNFTA